MQNLEEEGDYLESADNEKIQRLMLKAAKYERDMRDIKSLYQEYLELTALQKPDPALQSPTILDNAVKAAIRTAENLIKRLEKQDEERQLLKKTERVKFPSFSGKQGESIFKFKEGVPQGGQAESM